jgi:hypothetical protein
MQVVLLVLEYLGKEILAQEEILELEPLGVVAVLALLVW